MSIDTMKISRYKAWMCVCMCVSFLLIIPLLHGDTKERDVHIPPGIRMDASSPSPCMYDAERAR